MPTKDIFSTDGLENTKRHLGEPKVRQYLTGRWITRKQYDKLSTKQLLQIGEFNKKKKHHPKPSVVGKTNDDYKIVKGKKVLIDNVKAKGKKKK
eukprot:SAG22_NODE_542_length_9294_cov_156.554649_8_plen_94_part_00